MADIKDKLKEKLKKLSKEELKKRDNCLFIYCRVSTKKQKVESESLENQIELGKKKSKELELEYEVFNEGDVSGSKDIVKFLDKGEDVEDKIEGIGYRVELKKLLNLVEDGKVKNVFVYDNDRLSRNSNVWNFIRIKFMENEVTLYNSNSKIKLNNKIDNLLFGIISEVSRYENELRVDRLREGRRSVVRKGYYWGGESRIFGYDVIDKKLVINKDKSEIVKTIFKMYGEGRNINYIIGYLSENEIKTARGNDKFSDGSVEQILRNNMYFGYYYYKGELIKNKSVKFMDEKDEIVRRVRERKESNKKKLYVLNMERNKHNYYLTQNELLYCGECGERMGGRSIGKLESYYCRDRVKKYEKERVLKGDWKRGIGCKMDKGLDVSLTDEFVFNVVVESLKYSKLERDEFRRRMEKDRGLRGKDLENKKLKYERSKREGLNYSKNIEKRLEDVELELLLKKINKVTYNRRIKVLERELGISEESLMLLEEERKNELSVKGINDLWKEYSKDINRKMDIKKEDRVEFIKKYVDKIEVYLKKEIFTHIIKLHFNIPIINDKFEWKDKENKEKGYELKEGKNIKLLFVSKKKRVDGRKMRKIVV